MKRKRIHGLKKDMNGGIEGLPLQLLVLTVVAGVCLAAMLGWVNSIDAPKSISEVNVETGEMEVVPADGHYVSCDSVIICVKDQDKNALEGATVVLTGLNARTSEGKTVHATTDSNGKVEFDDIVIDMSGHVGYITVEVSKSEYGSDSSCRIIAVS